jgi:hypothetical protein
MPARHGGGRAADYIRRVYNIILCFTYPKLRRVQHPARHMERALGWGALDVIIILIIISLDVEDAEGLEVVASFHGEGGVPAQHDLDGVLDGEATPAGPGFRQHVLVVAHGGVNGVGPYAFGVDLVD